MRGQSVTYLQKDDIDKIINYLEKNNKVIILAIIKFALNTGLRISDILKLKFEDIDDAYIKEKKTKKIKKIIFNKICKKYVEILKKYYFQKGITNYNKGFLFKSIKNNKIDKPITYQGVNFYINLLKKDLNITYAFNTHSFRKTWARSVYTQYNDLALVMKLLNHSSPAITLRYIGIDEDRMSEVYKNICL